MIHDKIDQIEMTRLLDSWTYPKNAPQLLNIYINPITQIRVFRHKQHYTLLRAWWMGERPVLSCDEQDKPADVILYRLCELLKDK